MATIPEAIVTALTDNWAAGGGTVQFLNSANDLYPGSPNTETIFVKGYSLNEEIDPQTLKLSNIINLIELDINTIDSTDKETRLNIIINEARRILNSGAVTGFSTVKVVSIDRRVTVQDQHIYRAVMTVALTEDMVEDATGAGTVDVDFNIQGDLSVDGEISGQHYDSSGFLNRTDSDITFTSGTRTFAIAPSATSFVFWQTNTKYTKSAEETIVIADTAGLHVIYYDAGVLTVSVDPSHEAMDIIILDKVLVALIYWNATDNDDVVFADERHGLVMDGNTHHYLHDIFGMQYESGFGLSGYTLATATDAALNFEVTDGRVYDEDIELDIEDGDPVNQYEQQLSGADAELPVMYRDDVDGTWTEAAASTLPYLTAGTGRLAYNNDDGDGTFSQVEITNNKFVTYTIVVTNDVEYPIKMIQGQNQYDTKNDALEDGTAEILTFGDFPTPELDILYRFIMQTGDAYGGTKKGKIIEVTDFRGNPITGSAATSQDHGSLGGLADDDHDQYFLADGTRDATKAVIGDNTDATDPIEVLKLNIERAWSFRKRGTGAATTLRLEADVAQKPFWIGYDDGVMWCAKFTPDTTQAACKTELCADTEVGGYNVSEALMLGVDNAEWVPLMYTSNSDARAIDMSASTIIPSAAGGDNWLFWLPLPTTKGSLKLYVSGSRVGLADADGDDFVDATAVFGHTHSTRTIINNDPTDYNTVDEHDDTFVAHDCSGYGIVGAELAVSIAAVADFNLAFVALRCYYA